MKDSADYPEGHLHHADDKVQGDEREDDVVMRCVQAPVVDNCEHGHDAGQGDHWAEYAQGEDVDSVYDRIHVVGVVLKYK